MTFGWIFFVSVVGGALVVFGAWLKSRLNDLDRSLKSNSKDITDLYRKIRDDEYAYRAEAARFQTQITELALMLGYEPKFLPVAPAKTVWVVRQDKK